MQVNLSSSIAGTSLAASRGGESDAQSANAARQQASAEAPAGKPSDSNPIDAGDHASDRDGHGQQVLDVFERSRRRKDEPAQEQTEQQTASSTFAVPVIDDSETGKHLDFQA